MPRVIFHTPRLLARQLEPDDLPALVAVYGDADVRVRHHLRDQ